MKLTDNAIVTLKNFASINSGLVIKQGKLQRTISSPEKAVYVEAELEDDFPETVGIYDLPQLLGILTSLDSPDIVFGDKFLTISDDNLELRYFFCNPNLIVAPPDKELKISPSVSFTLPEKTLSKLLKVAGGLGVPHFVILGENGKLFISVAENENDTTNYGRIQIGETSESFKAVFNIEHLKLIPDNYNVELQLGSFAKFENENKTRRYFVSIQK